MTDREQVLETLALRAFEPRSGTHTCDVPDEQTRDEMGDDYDGRCAARTSLAMSARHLDSDAVALEREREGGPVTGKRARAGHRYLSPLAAADRAEDRVTVARARLERTVARALESDD